MLFFGGELHRKIFKKIFKLRMKNLEIFKNLDKLQNFKKKGKIFVDFKKKKTLLKFLVLIKKLESLFELFKPKQKRISPNKITLNLNLFSQILEVNKKRKTLFLKKYLLKLKILSENFSRINYNIILIRKFFRIFEKIIFELIFQEILKVCNLVHFSIKNYEKNKENLLKFLKKNKNYFFLYKFSKLVFFNFQKNLFKNLYWDKKGILKKNSKNISSFKKFQTNYFFFYLENFI
ncbi:hypothetical protein HAN_2g327 (nucleomorph) [Hemiselmis andersenii]|uniref:Uncharacterized protein n=1 Tax=Hemiselmis andersenii TaxID=464988 RepID=A9BKZ0_HEMAN|nr:hypothetical protein HAN_2g327 [Hemiselmis andersenii]ABW98145.1 hypothetical protein HAN_2g327 [Hemiselmis andersenii]